MSDNRPKRILVIEDELSIALLLEALLEEEGFEVLCTETGADGLAAHAESPFDVAIVDYGLPDTNGLQVLRALGEGPSKAIPRRILATGWNNFNEGDLEGLVDAVLDKPFKLSHVVQVVKRLAANTI